VSIFREKTAITLAVLLLLSVPLVTPRIAESDAVQYFSYLPSLLLDGDLDFEDEYTVFYKEDPVGRKGFKETFLDLSTATGKKLNFAPIGTAILWSPFYLGAHLVVGSEDGMSQPYRTAVSVGSVLYAAIGLLLCYGLARRYAAPFASFAAVIVLWWGTPVAYYMYVAPGMSHAASLFAVALFFTLWPWAVAGGVARWAVWGASAGLMALVREQDLFFAAAALVAAYGMTDRLKRLVVFGATALLVFLPQLAVYYTLYGRPRPAPQVENKMIKYSPHFFEVLFSIEHGLFLWTPVLLLFFAGGLWMAKKERPAGLVLLAAFLAQVYISGAVDSWTQAGAFGARRFVGATAIFAIWGGFLFAALEPRWKKLGVAALTSFFIVWNVSLMIQFGLGLMDRQRLVWSEIVHNHVYEVPSRLLSVVETYLWAREDLEGIR
jgi:hypothetical protein